MHSVVSFHKTINPSLCLVKTPFVYLGTFFCEGNADGIFAIHGSRTITR